MAQSEFRHVVRIAGQNLDGAKKVVPSLADLRGLGMSLAQHLLTALKIDPKLRLGQLSEGQLRELEEALRDPSRLGLPAFVVNRSKDPETGSNLHLVGADLQLMVKTDIDREKSVLSWRGLRHSLGLKVRGQRTRTTGRKGRAVGVRKAALEAAAAAARAAEEKK